MMMITNINNYQIIKLTLYDFRLSTTQANNASRPIVTVMFGIGSAKRGRFNSTNKVILNSVLSV